MRRTTRWVLGVTIALQVIAALAIGAAEAAAATLPGPNGEIAFVSGRGGPPNDDSGADVYILDEPNGAALPLTTAAGQHRHPSWAPDNLHIAYALFDGANDRDIWVHTVGAPERVRLTVSPLIQEDRPSYSPDGTKIAYESEVSDGSGQQDILITDVDSGDTINLTSSPNVIEGKPVWSPDGSQIYYSFDVLPVGDSDIYREASDNSQVVPSFVVNSAAEEYQPALSPDGTQMCFTRGPFGSTAADVYTVAASGLGQQVDLSDSAIGAYNCTFSPDGSQIAYVDGVFSNGALVSEPADDTGSSSLLTTNEPQHFDGNPDWARVSASCDGRPATIYGSTGDDRLKGTPGNDVIVTFAGDDKASGGDGKDRICGGKGDDGLKGKDGKDRLFGNGGRDSLNGGTDKDRCDGGPGKDVSKNCERETST